MTDSTAWAEPRACNGVVVLPCAQADRQLPDLFLRDRRFRYASAGVPRCPLLALTTEASMKLPSAPARMWRAPRQPWFDNEPTACQGRWLEHTNPASADLSILDALNPSRIARSATRSTNRSRLHE
jgi:hypothetical protein